MAPRLSVIITAFQEAETVGPAIDAFLAQVAEEAEIIVVCPDPQTIAVVDDYASRFPIVRHVADPQRGKPTAVNVGLEAARGDIVVLTDGDVRVADDAVAPLLTPLDDPDVGAVSGRPVSINSRDNVLGYWSHVLTDGIHRMRLARDRATRSGKPRFLLCSGYLCAFRRKLIDEVPKDALAEDAVISHRIAQQGARIRYAPDARVYVRYPTTYRDWLRQKVRSAGGYAQRYVRESPFRMRSPWLEARNAWRALTYPRNLQEFFWSLLLFGARLHLWSLVLVKVRLLRRPFDSMWKRVESTK